jgi:hypothetical protein
MAFGPFPAGRLHFLKSGEKPGADRRTLEVNLVCTSYHKHPIPQGERLCSRYSKVHGSQYGLDESCGLAMVCERPRSFALRHKEWPNSIASRHLLWITAER